MIQQFTAWIFLFKKFEIQELTVTPVKQVVRNPEVQVESCSEEKASFAMSSRGKLSAADCV